MNERIRELAQETNLVDIIREHHNEFGSGDVDYSGLEKFAELLIRECMDIAKHNIYEPDYRGGSQILESFENYQANRRAEDILNQIQKHFGDKL